MALLVTKVLCREWKVLQCVPETPEPESSASLTRKSGRKPAWGSHSIPAPRGRVLLEVWSIRRAAGSHGLYVQRL